MAEDGKKTTDDEELGEGGMRALRAERDENRNLRKELQALKDAKQAEDDSKLKDAEKWQRKYEQTQAELTSLKTANEQAALRQKIADEFSKDGPAIPVSLIAGTDEKSMRESAEQLKQFVGEQNAPRRPQPDSHLGKESSGDNNGSDDADRALSILGFGE